MARIIYSIDSGTAPFTASISPAVASDNIHNALGEYYFDDIPNGEYVITIIDADGCLAIFDVSVDCYTTTTSTTSTTSSTTTTTTTHSYDCDLDGTVIEFTTTTTTTTLLICNLELEIL